MCIFIIYVYMMNTHITFSPISICVFIIYKYMCIYVCIYVYTLKLPYRFCNI